MAIQQTWFIVCCAGTLSVLATVLWVLGTCTEWWEYSKYNIDTLQANHPNTESETYTVTYYPENGLIMLVRTDTSLNKTEYLFEEHGGIWQMCSYLSEENRTSLRNDNESGVTGWYSMYSCFIYVKHYKMQKIHNNMAEESKWLVRMQNSATSCVIVVFLLMLSSGVLAPFGVIKRAVAVCMVVAVMYGIGTVFAIFGICIIHAKIDFMNTDSRYIIGQSPTHPAYEARTVYIGWSIYVAWVSTVLQFLCFCMWTWVCRTIRLDKSAYMT